jgi:hypothetical protein
MKVKSNVKAGRAGQGETKYIIYTMETAFVS